uniref:Uncharacterized protein MANES_01G239500 n=1 Tax=Rhizophora mucronata TaxID=61149 RepID=A0A2P2M218_RHIMU
MSSDDSLSTVLKCMLKGAADFLLKPVRRNELRNIWQHVWRRQTPPAGHIPPMSYDAQHKIEAIAQNNAASDQSSDCATLTQKNRECGEKESDDQGFSQLKCRSASNLANAEREKYEKHVKLDKESVDSGCKAGERSNKLGAPCNGPYNSTALKLGEELGFAQTLTRVERLGTERDRENTHITHCNGSEPFKPSASAIDLISTFDNSSKCTYGHSGSNVGTNEFEFCPQLELSLRRFYPITSNGKGVDEKYSLNHSNASAFSWYNSKTLQPFFSNVS